MRLRSPVITGAFLVVFAIGVLVIVQQARRLERIGHENAALQREKAALLADALIWPERTDATTFPDETASRNTTNDRTWHAEAVRWRGAHTALAKRAAALEDDLRKAAESLDSVRHEASEAASVSAQIAARLRDSEITVEVLQAELEDLRQQRAADAALGSAQESHVATLRARVDELAESLARERQLLAAGRDIRELMGARNLHVIDVFDVDGKGRTRQAFGRVFYTEGRSLIFYAFDVGTRRASSESVFQAWGYREAADRERSDTRSLGIFYVDDSTQNRWVLKSEDARVLAEIDSVFVTIEPPGGSAAPSGQRLLYAYLRHNPNHP